MLETLEGVYMENTKNTVFPALIQKHRKHKTLSKSLVTDQKHRKHKCFQPSFRNTGYTSNI